MNEPRKRLADVIFLAALMIYILSGIRAVPPHGDEYMQMSMARDYFLVRAGQWDQLAYSPPVQLDSGQYLRLINGVINKYLIGLVWELSGRDPDALPGIYVWDMPLEWNQAQGNVPTLESLHLARLPSALLTALGLIPIFLLGWNLRLRSLAYPAALLYGFHPVILLNGERAMMEGSLMLFSLCAIYWTVALVVAEHSATAEGYLKRLPRFVRYALLGVWVGLAAASKHTGIIVGGAALLGTLAAALAKDKLGKTWRPAMLYTLLAGMVAGGVWFGLNPAFWRSPLSTLGETLRLRAELLNRQTESSDAAFADLGGGMGAILREPFLAPPQYAEAPGWIEALGESIQRYQSSPVNGWDWGAIIGLLLTLLALLGLVGLALDARRRDLIAWVILIWAGAAGAASLAVPLDWQRYYLPLILVAIILAASGLGRLLVRREG
ncbi:MAG: phospholipid carrier-dependent glycosyltransferase [Anaerolineae bacterium]|nr:phospholipid carrier-dependent glycosyltransferase [Anaerolineae bacterium]